MSWRFDERLRLTARRIPDSVALRTDQVGAQGQRTYAELETRVAAAAGALQARGVGPGDRVALVVGNTPDFVEAAYGVLRAGGVVVPLLPGLAPDELRHIVDDSQAAHVVAGPERGAELAALAPQVPALRELITLEPTAGAATTWAEVVDAGSEPRPVERAPDDLAALVYTSGTTGRPRGAMLSHRNLAANQDQSLAGRFEIAEGDVVLLVLPLAHIYAFNVGLGAAIAVGATTRLLGRFEPTSSLEVIQRDGVTVLLGAPPLYTLWLASDALRAEAFASVRLAVSGAAPLPIPTLHRFQQATGLVIEEGYGLTEAAPSVTSNAMGPAPRPGSVGLPLPDVQLRLVDDEGRDVTQGDPGEVWVKGPNVFGGYWNDEVATAATLTPDGWLRTGDIGTRDDDGWLYLVDRKRDLIIVNGFNVYPREVERVLATDPAVAACAAIGAPHEVTGETVVAFVVPEPQTEIDVERLHALCLENLARYKCPTRIEAVAELPWTATGKVRRSALRADPSPRRANAASRHTD